MVWHLLTPEYPPDCRGVGDYTAILAAALADSGDVVHVWHPHVSESKSSARASTHVTVHELPDRFGRHSRTVLDRAFTETPGTILVQYVPGAYGLRGANVPFCRWLMRTRRAGRDVRVMFHEPFFYFGLERPWRNALAVTQRLMATLLIRASTTLYLSTETWFQYLAPFGPVSDASVLPIPATLTIDPPAPIVASWRDRVRGDAQVVVGHFGTYGDHVGTELRQVLPAIWRMLPDTRVLLIGDGSRAFADRMGPSAPTAASLAATGRLSSVDAAAALRACDVLIAPFPDGVTTRRTSVMAALTSGCPVVTTEGPLTEPVWRETGAVALAPAGDAASFAREVKRLTGAPTIATALGGRGRRVYDERFDLSHTVSALRHAGVTVPVQ
jgi:glycosyltransferase involved in cell wall biosynthesis